MMAMEPDYLSVIMAREGLASRSLARQWLAEQVDLHRRLAIVRGRSSKLQAQKIIQNPMRTVISDFGATLHHDLQGKPQNHAHRTPNSY